MKKVIFSQVMTDNGIAEFSGVYDRNGLPVKIILEADDDGCENCIFRGDCDDEGEIK